MKQSKLVLEPTDFEGILENKAGIPSAHNPSKRYFPKFNGEKWICDGPQGPCKHFKIYKTPCRHILQKKYENIKDLWKRICEMTKDARDIRDEECIDFDEVVTIVEIYREPEVNRLCTLLLNIAILRGQVTSDDLHDATGEQYTNDKIVGVAVGSLLRTKLIECIGRQKTARKVAHGRSIGIYQLTEKGFEILEARWLKKELRREV